MKTKEQIQRKRAEIKRKAKELGKLKTLKNVYDMNVLLEQYEILGWVINEE